MKWTEREKASVGDYFLYLVTDSNPELLKGRDLTKVVEDALIAGVSFVQYREKTGDTKQLTTTAKRLHELTSAHNAALIINDRVDVALAVGAEGVHLGQDDMDIATARQLMGPDAVIGVSCSTVDEAVTAAQAGADYLGIGAIYTTPTKTDTKKVLGVTGAREILKRLEALKSPVTIVLIGGIDHNNIRDIIDQTNLISRATNGTRSGFAIVRAIMGAEDTTEAVYELQRTTQFALPVLGFGRRHGSPVRTVHELLSAVSPTIQAVATQTPLSHNMTNLVVQNFAANVALAIGGSPIMAGNGAEATDLAQISPGALVINMGSANADSLTHFSQAIAAYNAQYQPVLLDPVGAAATQLRRDAVKTLLAAGNFNVIKGNEGEIRAMLGADAEQQQRGVDSASSGLSLHERAELAWNLAQREGAVVLMTGATDIVTNARQMVAVRNGHALLGRITGSGCTLGTAISCCLAVAPDNTFLATLAGVLAFEIAAERAAADTRVTGPGTFVPVFLDKLAEISSQAAAEDATWVSEAKIEHLSSPQFTDYENRVEKRRWYRDGSDRLESLDNRSWASTSSSP